MSTIEIFQNKSRKTAKKAMSYLIAKKSYWKDPNGLSQCLERRSGGHVEPGSRFRYSRSLARLASAMLDRSRAVHSLRPGKNLEHVDVALSDRESLNYSNKK
jgi:hypothetical protein